jgi:hypothetical protein
MNPSKNVVFETHQYHHMNIHEMKVNVRLNFVRPNLRLFDDNPIVPIPWYISGRTSPHLIRCQTATFQLSFDCRLFFTRALHRIWSEKAILKALAFWLSKAIGVRVVKNLHRSLRLLMEICQTRGWNIKLNGIGKETGNSINKWPDRPFSFENRFRPFSM